MNKVAAFLRTRRCRHHGITLIETCIVLTVTAIVAATAAPAMQDLLDRRRLEGAAALLVTDIHFVRSESVARNQPLRLSIHASPTGMCYVIHSGAPDDCRCDTTGPAG